MESPDELILRAEEVGTWRSYINVDHMEKERWGPPLVDYDWYALCQASHKGIEGEDWGMSRVVGSEEGTGGPKSKSPLENEDSQRCRRRTLRPHA